ncbi:hypothetical protein BESB_024470 [Besnoitia besnoiti]|uniref:Uncharacterized protein n=1 Tax=Besnoitia besnoiti TaxID=94643 RepID=A0A2A9M1U3_BESBE|nr:hypothetical protein BESB_024470 [Besnoitia besnoiti]PFH31955.1 hypothetical protein BESB_024470 [Besnoitia besnoiti]
MVPTHSPQPEPGVREREREEQTQPLVFSPVFDEKALARGPADWGPQRKGSPGPEEATSLDGTEGGLSPWRGCWCPEPCIVHGEGETAPLSSAVVRQWPAYELLLHHGVSVSPGDDDAESVYSYYSAPDLSSSRRLLSFDDFLNSDEDSPVPRSESRHWLSSPQSFAQSSAVRLSSPDPSEGGATPPDREASPPSPSKPMRGRRAGFHPFRHSASCYAFSYQISGADLSSRQNPDCLVLPLQGIPGCSAPPQESPPAEKACSLSNRQATTRGGDGGLVERDGATPGDSEVAEGGSEDRATSPPFLTSSDEAEPRRGSASLSPGPLSWRRARGRLGLGGSLASGVPYEAVELRQGAEQGSPEQGEESTRGETACGPLLLPLGRGAGAQGLAAVPSRCRFWHAEHRHRLFRSKKLADRRFLWRHRSLSLSLCRNGASPLASLASSPRTSAQLRGPPPGRGLTRDLDSDATSSEASPGGSCQLGRARGAAGSVAHVSAEEAHSGSLRAPGDRRGLPESFARLSSSSGHSVALPASPPRALATVFAALPAMRASLRPTGSLSPCGLPPARAGTVAFGDASASTAPLRAAASVEGVGELQDAAARGWNSLERAQRAPLRRATTLLSPQASRLAGCTCVPQPGASAVFHPFRSHSSLYVHYTGRRSRRSLASRMRSSPVVVASPPPASPAEKGLSKPQLDAQPGAGPQDGGAETKKEDGPLGEETRGVSSLSALEDRRPRRCQTAPHSLSQQGNNEGESSESFAEGHKTLSFSRLLSDHRSGGVSTTAEREAASRQVEFLQAPCDELQGDAPLSARVPLAIRSFAAAGSPLHPTSGASAFDAKDALAFGPSHGTRRMPSAITETAPPHGRSTATGFLHYNGAASPVEPAGASLAAEETPEVFASPARGRSPVTQSLAARGQSLTCFTEPARGRPWCRAGEQSFRFLDALADDADAVDDDADAAELAQHPRAKAGPPACSAAEGGGRPGHKALLRPGGALGAGAQGPPGERVAVGLRTYKEANEACVGSRARERTASERSSLSSHFVSATASPLASSVPLAAGGVEKTPSLSDSSSFSSPRAVSLTPELEDVSGLGGEFAEARSPFRCRPDAAVRHARSAPESPCRSRGEPRDKRNASSCLPRTPSTCSYALVPGQQRGSAFLLSPALASPALQRPPLYAALQQVGHSQPPLYALPKRGTSASSPARRASPVDFRSLSETERARRLEHLAFTRALTPPEATAETGLRHPPAAQRAATRSEEEEPFSGGLGHSEDALFARRLSGETMRGGDGDGDSADAASLLFLSSPSSSSLPSVHLFPVAGGAPGRGGARSPSAVSLWSAVSEAGKPGALRQSSDPSGTTTLVRDALPAHASFDDPRAPRRFSGGDSVSVAFPFLAEFGSSREVCLDLAGGRGAARASHWRLAPGGTAPLSHSAPLKSSGPCALVAGRQAGFPCVAFPAEDSQSTPGSSISSSPAVPASPLTPAQVAAQASVAGRERRGKRATGFVVFRGGAGDLGAGFPEEGEGVPRSVTSSSSTSFLSFASSPRRSYEPMRPLRVPLEDERRQDLTYAYGYRMGARDLRRGAGREAASPMLTSAEAERPAQAIHARERPPPDGLAPASPDAVVALPESASATQVIVQLYLEQQRQLDELREELAALRKEKKPQVSDPRACAPATSPLSSPVEETRHRLLGAGVVSSWWGRPSGGSAKTPILPLPTFPLQRTAVDGDAREGPFASGRGLSAERAGEGRFGVRESRSREAGAGLQAKEVKLQTPLSSGFCTPAPFLVPAFQPPALPVAARHQDATSAASCATRKHTDDAAALKKNAAATRARASPAGLQGEGELAGRRKGQEAASARAPDSRASPRLEAEAAEPSLSLAHRRKALTTKAEAGEERGPRADGGAAAERSDREEEEEETWGEGCTVRARLRLLAAFVIDEVFSYRLREPASSSERPSTATAAPGVASAASTEPGTHRLAPASAPQRGTRMRLSASADGSPAEGRPGAASLSPLSGLRPVATGSSFLSLAPSFSSPALHALGPSSGVAGPLRRVASDEFSPRSCEVAELSFLAHAENGATRGGRDARVLVAAAESRAPSGPGRFLLESGAGQAGATARWSSEGDQTPQASRSQDGETRRVAARGRVSLARGGRAEDVNMRPQSCGASFLETAGLWLPGAVGAEDARPRASASQRRRASACAEPPPAASASRAGGVAASRDQKGEACRAGGVKGDAAPKKSREEEKAEDDNSCTIPDTPLGNLSRVPYRLERVVYLGTALCLDAVLYEVTFMPIQALVLVVRLAAHALFGGAGGAKGRGKALEAIDKSAPGNGHDREAGESLTASHAHLAGVRWTQRRGATAEEGQGEARVETEERGEGRCSGLRWGSLTPAADTAGRASDRGSEPDDVDAQDRVVLAGGGKSRLGGPLKPVLALWQLFLALLCLLRQTLFRLPWSPLLSRLAHCVGAWGKSFAARVFWRRRADNREGALRLRKPQEGDGGLHGGGSRAQTSHAKSGAAHGQLYRRAARRGETKKSERQKGHADSGSSKSLGRLPAPAPPSLLRRLSFFVRHVGGVLRNAAALPGLRTALAAGAAGDSGESVKSGESGDRRRTRGERGRQRGRLNGSASRLSKGDTEEASGLQSALQDDTRPKNRGLRAPSACKADSRGLSVDGAGVDEAAGHEPEWEEARPPEGITEKDARLQTDAAGGMRESRGGEEVRSQRKAGNYALLPSERHASHSAEPRRAAGPEETATTSPLPAWRAEPPLDSVGEGKVGLRQRLKRASSVFYGWTRGAAGDGSKPGAAGPKATLERPPGSPHARGVDSEEIPLAEVLKQPLRKQQSSPAVASLTGKSSVSAFPRSSSWSSAFSPPSASPAACAYGRWLASAFPLGFCDLPPLLAPADVCALVRFSLLVASVSLFMLLDTSRIYHYIRAQPFMKLYVVFNMLELFEKMWRSLGRDVIDALMRTTWWGRSYQWRLWVFQYFLVLGYVLVHTFMHLVRVLSLNIAINSSESAMFLIVVTNNFGEIKSTVFKKFCSTTLYSIVAADVVERFQLCCDAFIVSLKLATAASPRATSLAAVCSWLCGVFLLEIAVDWVKFLSLVKFNNIRATAFEQYQRVLLADVLLSRVPQAQAHLLPSTSFKVPCRRMYAFSHIPTRRIGFMELPIVTLIVACLPVVSWTSTSTLVCAFFGWVCLFVSKVVLSLMIVAFATKRRKEFLALEPPFGKINAL